MRHYEATKSNYVINFLANHFNEAVGKAIRIFAISYPSISGVIKIKHIPKSTLTKLGGGRHE